MYCSIEGGDTMRTADGEVAITPGSVLSHPPGELHEYANGAERSLLFRVRYGADKCARLKEWLSNPKFKRCDIDDEYFGG